MALQAWEKKFFSEKMLACPLRGHWVSFRLVDEFGSGKPYGGLHYELLDTVGQKYSGRLDGDGFAKLENCYRGPVMLTLNRAHMRTHELYWQLMDRDHYPLPITELQVRAEETSFFHQDGFRIEHNPAQKEADEFAQVEVKHLVKHIAHLPPPAKRFYEPRWSLLKAMGDLGFGPEQPELWGVGLLPNKHHVLEVRPLRAFRPMLSTDDAFCALNLYQLSLMATLSYADFGQIPPARPINLVHFPHSPTIGNLFSETLGNYHEAWQVDKGQRGERRYYPIYEEVPYSKRFEITPFDPELYEENHPDKGDEQEHPAKLHFYDDKADNQAFICHHDEIILIVPRGTASMADALRDTDARQVDFKDGVGRVHRGFYEAFKAIRPFVDKYLSKFYSGQRIIICGHSLGGAIALLLAEALRREPRQNYNILLYTYGAPRTGDKTFVDGAADLVHHRIVNHNDPVPSVPATWMDTEWKYLLPGLITITHPLGVFAFLMGLFRTSGEPYQHHGQQQHFMPVEFKKGVFSSILWDPDCESINDAGCARAVEKHQRRGDMPKRASFLAQILQATDHMMLDSYIPNAWATLRRWQQAHASGSTVVTLVEYQALEAPIAQLQDALDQKDLQLSRRDASDDINSPLNQQVISLRIEVNRLETTKERLKALSYLPMMLENVYGSATTVTPP